MRHHARTAYPLATRLDTLIVSYSLHLTIALIVLPMLMWHISSTRVLDDYGMPKAWTDEFYSTQFSAGRTALWVLLFALVPIDCVHALLALDWMHGRRYRRGVDTEEDIAEAFATQGLQHRPPSPCLRQDCPTGDVPVPLATRCPRTCHPLLSPRLRQRSSLLLLTMYDCTLLGLLICHSTTFLVQLPDELAACAAYVDHYPDPQLTNMEVSQRCQRIYVDVGVGGGSSVALCMVLGGVHLWHMGFRIWEWALLGLGYEGNGMKMEREKSNHTDRLIDGGNEEMGGDVGEVFDEYDEGMRKHTEVRDVEKAEGHRGTKGNTVDNSVAKEQSLNVESSRWDQVLLECLVP